MHSRDRLGTRMASEKNSIYNQLVVEVLEYASDEGFDIGIEKEETCRAPYIQASESLCHQNKNG